MKRTLCLIVYVCLVLTSCSLGPQPEPIRKVAQVYCDDVDNPFINLETYLEREFRGHLNVIADPVYATKRNVLKRPLKGYMSHKIWTTTHVARALALKAVPAIKKELTRINVPQKIIQRVVIIVKDGYRPYRASRELFLWGEPLGFAKEGYVAAGVSGHNLGMSVDLTLGYRSNDGTIKEIWMGATFDEFSKNSHNNLAGQYPQDFLDTDWENLQTLATDGRYYILDNVDLNELRDSLRLGMDVAGFSSYYKEYWHFSYRDHLKIYGDICYDRPIQ